MDHTFADESVDRKRGELAKINSTIDWFEQERLARPADLKALAAIHALHRLATEIEYGLSDKRA